MRSFARFLSVCFAAAGFPSALAAQNPDLTLRLEAPAGELRTGSEFEARVILDSKVGGIRGWSIAVAHDPEALELVSARPGATTAVVNDGKLPDFLNVNTTPLDGTGVIMGVVICLTCGLTLDAGDGYELLVIRYRVLADPAQQDPCEPIRSAIAFSSTLGRPPVSNVITIRSASERPMLVDAEVAVRCPGSIEFTRCEGRVDDVVLEWAFGGEPSWDFLFLYRNSELLSLLDVDATSYNDTGLEGGIYDYTLLTFVVEDPMRPQLIFSHCRTEVIPITLTGISPAIADWAKGAEVRVTGTAFTHDPITGLFFIAAGEDPLPLEILSVTSDTELRALAPRAPRIGRYGLRIETEKAFAELPDSFEYGFVRGEMNGDGTIDISDPVFLLGFLFLGEGEPPVCQDSADANDDGDLDISDPVLVLNHLFIGEQIPSPPYPAPGRDPTPADRYGCLTPPVP